MFFGFEIHARLFTDTPQLDIRVLVRAFWDIGSRQVWYCGKNGVESAF